MPLLRPDTSHAMEIFNDVTRNVPSTNNSKTNERKRASALLEEHGLGLEQSCMVLAELARGAGNENIKYRANQDAMKVHGAFDGVEGNNIPNITFVVQQDCDVMQILTPMRTN